jgi:hypothetical protein
MTRPILQAINNLVMGWTKGQKFKDCSKKFLFLVLMAAFFDGGFKRRPVKDYPNLVRIKLDQWFQKRRF